MQLLNLKNFINLILALFLICCSAVEEKSNLEEKKTLIMGVTADYPPFEYIKNKKIVGFDVDLAQAIAKKLGYQIYIKDMNFDALIPALHADRIDFAMSAMTKTPARSKAVDFSIPYFTPTFAMIYKKDRPIKSIKDFDNKVIAAQLGSTMEGYLQEKSEKAKNMNVLSLTRNPTMIEELKVGRIDGVMVEEAQAAEFVKRNPDLGYSLFSEENDGFSVAFPKGSALTKKFDDAILELRDSGEIDQLKAKWMK